MPSGAGHDAQDMTRIAPTGMIFVPSVDGVSHSPREFTEIRDIANGADVLVHTLLRIDLSSTTTLQPRRRYARHERCRGCDEAPPLRTAGFQPASALLTSWLRLHSSAGWKPAVLRR